MSQHSGFSLLDCPYHCVSLFCNVYVILSITNR